MLNKTISIILISLISLFVFSNVAFSQSDSLSVVCNLEYEYVIIKNMSKGDLNLTGWKIMDRKSESGKRYTFIITSELVLKKSESVIIVYGSSKTCLTRETASEMATYVIRAFKKAIWNNDGDAITIENQHGQKVYEAEIGSKDDNWFSPVTNSFLRKV